MRLGSCHLWGDDLTEFRQEVRLASDLGFGVIAIGDSPAGWHELYISMMVAAQEAPEATITPFVTSPFLRHPLVAANSLCSLDEVTGGGRIAMGLATGGSNVMAISRAQANQAEIRDYFQAFKQLVKGEPATYEGRAVSPLRHPRRIPLYYSAFGPKALQLAGEQADGVILFTNHDLTALSAKIETVRAAAKNAGRDPKDVDIWVTAFTSVRESRAAALDDLRAFIIVCGMNLANPRLLPTVPSPYKERLVELKKRYDPTEHVVVGGKNARLLDELELMDFLGNFDTVADTPAAVKKILDGIAALGVSTFICTLPGHADKLGTLQRLSKVMNGG